MEVYKITNTINGKVYVGITSQGIRTRFLHHLYEARSGSTFPIHAALRKYGEDAFTVELIENYFADYEELKLREIYWIKELDSNNREKGYNLTEGGDGTKGKKHSEETKAKLSAVAKGRKMSVETKVKIKATKQKNGYYQERVVVFLKDGDETYYCSVTEASNETGIPRTTITSYLGGRRKCKEGEWKYFT